MGFDRFCIFFCLALLPILRLPQNLLIAGIGLGAACILFSLFRKDRLLFVLGVLIVASYFQIMEAAKSAEKMTAHKAVYRFKIVKILKQKEYRTAIAELNDKRRIYLNWQAETPLLLERQYRAELTVRPISARANIGNFDRQRWYFAHHIQGIATVRKVDFSEKRRSSLRAEWLARSYRQTEELALQGLLLALAFGERAWLDEQAWRVFQHTSTAHLIAISGLHIGLAIGIGFGAAKSLQWLMLYFKTGGRLGLSYSFPRLIGFLFALFYSYLAGFSVPTLRALTAIAIVSACRLFRRHYSVWQLWWRVLALLLLADPISILSDSFWLSIMAVLSLIIWYRYFPLSRFVRLENCKKANKFNRLLIPLLHLQLGIWLIFSPVQLFFFEGVSPYAFFANLAIVPFYSLVLVPIILFSLLTDNLFYSWQWADWGAQISLFLLRPLAGNWISLDVRQQGCLLLLNFSLLFGLYQWGRKTAKYRLFLVVIGVFGLAAAVRWLPLLRFTPQWVTFDVGQGLAQALVYQTDGQKKAVFYDTGASWKGKNQTGNSMAVLEILPYLRRNGIRVEAVFLSHDDNDHAGGAADLLAEFPQARLISSGKTVYAQRRPEACVTGNTWRFGPFLLQAVHPSEQVTRAKNEDSCIILVKIDRLQLLFTGDATIEQERLVVRRIGEIDFLQAGHHGSKTSTGHNLLKHAKPKTAVVSVGRWNPWRMPHPQVIERLEENGVQILSTAETGMVRVNFAGEAWKVETARDNLSPWYRVTYGTKK